VADNDFARQVAAAAEAHPRLEVLAPPVLSICGFRYRTDADLDWDTVNSRLMRRLVRETGTIVSSTFVDGHYALRPCFINARTTPAHVDRFLDTTVRFGDEIVAGMLRRGAGGSQIPTG
jgi:aromatic-L-amino-acid decarboxylase